MSPLTTPHPAATRSATSFRSSASRTEATALVAFRGELDLAAAPAAAAALRAQLEAGARDVLVDLGQVTYLDCAGLSAIVAMAREADLTGGRIYLFRAHGRPAELITWARREFAIAGL
jgi:anti-anti-sigma factor